MFLMADVTVAFWYSQWRQSCRQPTDNMQFRLFSNIGPCIQQHYVLRNHWLCRHFAIPPMTTGLSSWLHYGQNIHGPKYVRIEGFRDHGRVAVLRYHQWRRGCHLDCIMDKTYMDRNTSVQRRIEGFRDHWPRCCLAIPPMATGLSSWLHYGQNIHGPKYVRIEGFRDHWPRCCLAIPPMATGLSSWLHYGQNIHGPKYVRTTSDWGLSWSLAALLSCDTANGDKAVILTALCGNWKCSKVLSFLCVW